MLAKHQKRGVSLLDHRGFVLHPTTIPISTVFGWISILRGKRKKRLHRKTDVFIRQGEWFFIPVADVQVNEKLILTNEPISRGRGKPHMCENLYRDGGTTVYVCGRHPNGLTVDQYR